MPITRDNWRPISTYPVATKKWLWRGYDIMLTNGKEVYIGYPIYDHDDDGTPSVDGWRLCGGSFEFNPTHWMELPELP